VHFIWPAEPIFENAPGNLSVTNGNITRHGDPRLERKAGENAIENPRVTSGKFIEATRSVTCEYEYLLKACASRQEKPPFCNKNSAARDPHIADP
jgi:hypothetical protein